MRAPLRCLLFVGDALRGSDVPEDLTAFDITSRIGLPGVVCRVERAFDAPGPTGASAAARPTGVFAPTHVIVALGIADLLREGGSPERLVDACRSLLERISRAHPSTPILVCSAPPLPASEVERNASIVLLNRGLLSLAEERGLGFVDLHGMLRDDLAPRPAIDNLYSAGRAALRGIAMRRLRDALAGEIGLRSPRLVEDALRDAGDLVLGSLTRTAHHAVERAQGKGLFARELDPRRDRVALLFFGDVERDRWIRGDRVPRRFARLVRHALTHRQRTSGFTVAFQALCKALSRRGYQVIVNDHALARKNPLYPVGIAGYPHILERWSLPNPAVLGPGLFDHPGQAPHLLEDPRFKAYLVPEGWMMDLFRGGFGDLCLPWHAGVDLASWPSFRAAKKDIDVLVYVKFLWDREAGERAVLAPLLAALGERRLRVHVLRYGTYEPGEYRALLRRSTSMAYVCEHETQGIAYAEAMACDVPLFAWDQGKWLDPIRLRFGTPDVPASSVPYFDATCGERFSCVGEIGPALDRFLGGLSGYAPRAFVARRISLEGSADLYEAALRRASPRWPRWNLCGASVISATPR